MRHSRTLIKLFSVRRGSDISWLLESSGASGRPPGLLVVLEICFSNFPRDKWGLANPVLLISFISSSRSGSCGSHKDERSLGQNPGKEGPESLGSGYYSPGPSPWALVLPPLNLEKASVPPAQPNYGASFPSCIDNLGAVFSSQEFRKKWPIHLELYCLKEIVAWRKAAVGFLKVQNNQAVYCASTSDHGWLTV